MHRMRTTFFLVKFFEKEIRAKKFVRGEIFAKKLSEFKQAEDSNESGRMDRHEGTTALWQPGKGRLTSTAWTYKTFRFRYRWTG